MRRFALTVDLEEFKREAVQMLLDGHSAASVLSTTWQSLRPTSREA